MLIRQVELKTMVFTGCCQ